MDRRHAIALAAVLMLALGLRLWLVFGQRSDVLFDQPALDEARYVGAARAMAAGEAVEQRPFWQPPGHTYALAAIFRVAGPGLLVPRLVQALVSVACCLLLFAVARRLFDERVAIAAAAILAVHGVLVFESYELLPATWILFFDLLALLVVLIAGERRTPATSFAAGLALGVAAVFAPTILPFAACVAVWLRRPALVAALVVGTVLPIVPVTVRNYQQGGELVLVSTNSGMNFYLGNNPDYRETFQLRPGRHWDDLDQEPFRNGADTPGAASRYFWRKGLAFYRDHPLDAALLLGRKGYLFLHAAEIPRDTDIYAARDSSTVLAVLVWPGPIRFPGVVLIPLALVGLALCWRERRRLVVPYAFLATQALVGTVFFVSSRHRVPALAMFALFAAAGGVALVRRWRDAAGPRGVLPVAGAAAAIAVIISLPIHEARVSYAAERDFYRGLAYRVRGDADASVAAFRRAAALDPDDARVWWELGETLDAAGRPSEAVEAWRRAAPLDPWDSRPARRASALLVQLGDPAGAAAMLEAHIDAAQRPPAHYASDHLNLVFLFIKSGELGRAREALRAAASADASYCRDKLPGLTRSLLGGPPIDDPQFWADLAAVNRELGLDESARAAADRSH